MAFTKPRIVRFQGGKLDNNAFGFPRGEKRKMVPFVLMCLHITGNRSTASMPVGIGQGTGTRAEVLYMARERRQPDLGNSAHTYVARDGSALDCIPTDYAAWNNGNVQKPNMKLDSIGRIVRMRTLGHNANEAYVREVECTGYPGKFPLTPQQKETVAYLIAVDSIEHGLPISRETVHAHTDIDSIDRQLCPFNPGSREKQLAEVIDLAREIKREILSPDPKPKPVPKPEPEPSPSPDPCADLRDQLAAAEGEADAQRERADELLDVVGQVVTIITPWLDPA